MSQPEKERKIRVSAIIETVEGVLCVHDRSASRKKEAFAHYDNSIRNLFRGKVQLDGLDNMPVEDLINQTRENFMSPEMAVFLDEADLALKKKSLSAEGIWSLPGGDIKESDYKFFHATHLMEKIVTKGLNRDEKDLLLKIAAYAAIREVSEEIGLSLDIPSVTPRLEIEGEKHPDPNRDFRRDHIVFIVRTEGEGVVRINTDDLNAIGFLDYDSKIPVEWPLCNWHVVRVFERYIQPKEGVLPKALKLQKKDSENDREQYINIRRYEELLKRSSRAELSKGYLSRIKVYKDDMEKTMQLNSMAASFMYPGNTSLELTKKAAAVALPTSSPNFTIIEQDKPKNSAERNRDLNNYASKLEGKIALPTKSVIKGHRKEPRVIMLVETPEGIIMLKHKHANAQRQKNLDQAIAKYKEAKGKGDLNQEVRLDAAVKMLMEGLWVLPAGSIQRDDYEVAGAKKLLDYSQLSTADEIALFMQVIREAVGRELTDQLGLSLRPGWGMVNLLAKIQSYSRENYICLVNAQSHARIDRKNYASIGFLDKNPAIPIEDTHNIQFYHPVLLSVYNNYIKTDRWAQSPFTNIEEGDFNSMSYSDLSREKLLKRYLSSFDISQVAIGKWIAEKQLGRTYATYDSSGHEYFANVDEAVLDLPSTPNMTIFAADYQVHHPHEPLNLTSTTKVRVTKPDKTLSKIKSTPSKRVPNSELPPASSQQANADTTKMPSDTDLDITKSYVRSKPDALAKTSADTGDSSNHESETIANTKAK